LDDGSSLMLYNLRRKDGSLSPYSAATLMRADGSTRPLSPADFHITATATWRSPHSRAIYPAAWTVDIPSEGIQLQVKPYLADQELRLSFTYWEGAVQVTGRRQGGQAVAGSGYVELTGYSESLGGQL
jgi:predicted secreted hydrolase